MYNMTVVTIPGMFPASYVNHRAEEFSLLCDVNALNISVSKRLGKAES